MPNANTFDASLLSSEDKEILSLYRNQAKIIRERGSLDNNSRIMDTWPQLWLPMKELLEKYRIGAENEGKYLSADAQSQLDQLLRPIWAYIDSILSSILVDKTSFSRLLSTSSGFLSLLVHSWMITVHMPSTGNANDTAFFHVGSVANQLYRNIHKEASDTEVDLVLDTFIHSSPPKDSNHHLTSLCLSRIRREITYAAEFPTRAFDPSILSFVLTIFERLTSYNDSIYHLALKNGSIPLLSSVLELLTSQKQKFASGHVSLGARYGGLYQTALYFSTCLQESPNWVCQALDHKILQSIVKCFPIIGKIDRLVHGSGSFLEEPAEVILRVIWCYTKFFLSVTNRVTKAVKIIDDLELADEDMWNHWAPNLYPVWCAIAIEVTEKYLCILRKEFWVSSNWTSTICAYKECETSVVSNPKACSLCRSHFYCSKACQRTDWKLGHKETCQSIRSDISAGHPGPISTLDKSFSVYAASCAQVYETPLVIRQLKEYLLANPHTPNSLQLHATLDYRNLPLQVTVAPYSASAFPSKDPTANYICTILVFGTTRRYTRAMPWSWRSLVNGETPFGDGSVVRPLGGFYEESSEDVDEGSSEDIDEDGSDTDD
ncbi:hypothetical protein BDP27DRAFT_1452287 [Rhodocollybia butyracea]|uniref:MYND-type domain-containing protein n=1 Tax=Rhodocollybia butyracea TaxID=206335 RepID=A0A9P5PFW6_9AGAR|nr:hypothetical protein BDP27DRAFT_1452287 [Rhodocollybia butyracea]